jgi:hypothetical protein
MEIVLFWIIGAVIWAAIKGVFNSSSEEGEFSNNSESGNKFAIKVTKGLPQKDTGIKVDCFNVEMIGMISHPTDDRAKIILILQDITDNENENDGGAPIVSANQAFAETGSRVFNVERSCDTSPTHYFPDWARFISVPLDFIIPPHKGQRKLKFSPYQYKNYEF